MITSTHALLSLAVLSKRGEKARNWSVLSGSLVPDLAIFLWAPYQRFVNGVSGKEMWNVLYFEPPMQNLIAWFNSIPIYTALAIIGYIGRGRVWGKLLLVFALAALIHIATDMPVHAEDAYRHFWPISDWRFYSPFSYWDYRHYGRWVGRLDIAIGLVCAAILWRRFPRPPVKITLAIISAFYMLTLVGPFFFG